MRIIGPDTLYFNANFQALTQLIFLYNADRHATARGVEVEVDHKHPAVVTDLVFGWVASGGEVEGFPAFIEMTAAAYGSDVPAGIPNRSYTDEEGNEVTRKWSEWKDATHEHVVIGTKNYVPANAFGEDLKGSELAIIHALTGASVLTAAEYKALLPVSDDAE